MKEIIHSHTDSINKSKILKKLNLNKQEYIVVSVHREKNVDNKSNLLNILESLESIYNKYKRRIIFSIRGLKINLKIYQRILASYKFYKASWIF